MLVGGGFLLYRLLDPSADPVQSERGRDATEAFDTLDIPLNEIASANQIALSSSRSLNINGQLRVDRSLILTPSTRPTAGIAGQMYFDRDTSQLSYYNGSGFVELGTNPQTVTSIGGSSGILTLGGGLSLSGNQLTSSTGIVSVTSASTNLTVANDGSGNVTIANTPGAPQGVQSVGGTSGHIALFNGTQTIGDSLLSQASGTLTADANIQVNGAIELQSAGNVTLRLADTVSGVIGQIYNDGNLHVNGGQNNLWLDAGGSGTIFMNAANGNKVAINQATNPDYPLEVNGDINISDAGGSLRIDGTVICTITGCVGSGGGGGGVSSLNGLSGALTLANSTGVGTTVTINDATTAAKGIASFNPTNFSVSSGAVNTIQNINTAAAPSFGQLALTSSQASAAMLTINNTNGAATGNLIDLKLNGTSEFSVGPTGDLLVAGTINGQTISSAASLTGTLGVTGNISTSAGLFANSANITSNASVGGNLNVTGITSTNTITPTGALTVGATSLAFTLQGNASSSITATGGGFTTALGFTGTPIGAVNYNFDRSVAAGTYNVCTTAGNCAGVGGGVTTAGGTAGTLAKFTAGQAIGDSIITDNGATITIGGALAVNTITPSAAMTVGATSQNLTLQGAVVTLSATNSGITNSLVFATPATSNKTITIPNAAGTVAVSASGPLALDSSGNLTCPSCVTSGGGGGGVGAVDSLDGLTGALTLVNSSGSGTTVTIDNASTSAKGIASFNSTNFSASSGAINTIQNINTTAAPQFGQLTLTSSQASAAMLAINNTNASATGNLLDLQLNGASKFSVAPSGNTTVAGTLTSGAVNGQTISSSANFTGSLTVGTTLATNTITPTGALTVGATSQSFTVQGNAGSTVTATNSGNTTTLGFQTPTANVTYRLLTATAGTYDICTTVGNCVGTGGGVSTPGGTTNRIAKFTGSQTLGDSLLSESGSTVTVAGGLNLTTGNTFQINGAQISSANLSNDSNLAKLNGTQSFTGDNTFTGTLLSQNTADSTAAFQIQNAAGRRVLTLDTTNKKLTLGNITSTASQGIAGTLVLADGTSDNFGLTLNTTTLTADRTISLPNEAGTICLQASTNCGFALSSGSGNYIQNGTTVQAANFYVQSANGSSVGAIVRGNSGGQTADIFQVLSAATGTPLFQVSGNTNYATFTDNLIVNAQTNATAALEVKSSDNVSGNLIVELKRNNGDSEFRFTNGGVLGIGNTTATAGTLALADGSSNFGNLATASLSSDRTYTLPDGSGTICLDSGNCGSATGTLQAAYTFSTGSTTPEIKLDGARGSIDIQDADTTLGTNVNFLTLRASNGGAGGLGTNVFGVGIRGDLYMRPSTDTTTLITVRKQSGGGSGSGLFVLDSTNGRLGLNLGGTGGVPALPAYTLDVAGDINTSTALLIGGTSICDTSGTTGCTAKSGSGYYIHNQTTLQSANMFIQASDTSAPTAVFEQAASGTADVLNVLKNDGTTKYLSVSSAGNLAVANGSTYSLNSTTSGSIASSGAITMTAGGGSTWSTSSGSLTIQAATTNSLNLQTGGAGTINVGINNTTAINIGNNSNIARTISIGATGGGSQSQTVNIGNTGGSSPVTINSGTGNTILQTGGAVRVYNATNTTSTSVFEVHSDVTTTNNTVFKILANGDIFTDGSTTIGTPADIAENYPVNEPVEAGDVVIFSDGMKLGKTTTPYDSRLAGVISSEPGIILSGNTNGSPLALKGRVPVKVSAENGAIASGDPLTASATRPGYAMKATGAGSIIGTALSPLADGTGKVEVFLNVGYNNPAQNLQGTTEFQDVTVQGALTTKDLTVSGTANINKLNVTGTATITNLTVTSLTTSTITINGHLVTGGGNPTVSNETCDGTTTTVSGTDTAGLITVTTPAGCANSGNITTVDFAKAFGAAPRVSLTPANASAAQLQTYVDSGSITPASFTIATPTPIDGSQTYKWYYQVLQ